MATIPDVPDVYFAPMKVLIKVRVFSFGYLWHPNPAELASSTHLDIAVDLRGLLHNPYHDPALRELTGLEPLVRDYVLSTPGAVEIVASTAGLTLAALRQRDKQGLVVSVAFGCAGGRHRSVVLANELRNMLELAGIGADVTHHDVLRPVYRRESGEDV
jgi:UPF0042 nucleotide-binding protein